MGRIRNKLTDGKQKAFIPSLSSLASSDGFSTDSQSRIREYKSKGDQIDANVGWVYAANDFIAEDFAAVETTLFDLDKDEAVEEHELLSLIDNPNKLQNTEYTFRELYATYIKLTGEFYALPVFIGENDPVPAAIHILPPHVCSVDWGKTYDETTVRVGGNQTYKLTDLYRDIKPDPKNPKEGRGVVTAAASAIDIDEKAKEYNQQFYANSARPSIVVETAEELTAKERKRFEQQFNDRHTGVDSAFKPLIIEGGKVTFGMLTQKEMDFLETRKFTKTEIFAMFKIPEALVGITASFNRSNIEGAEYIYSKRVLEPLAKKWVKFWNQTLIARYNEKTNSNLVLRHKSTIPEDVEQKLSVVKSTGGILLIDEQRKLLGYEPLPNEEGAVLARPQASRFTLTDEEGEKKSVIDVKKKDLKRSSKDFGVDGEEKYYRYLEKAQRFESGFQTKAAMIFKEQEKAIVEAVRTADLKSMYKNHEPKKRKDVLSETLDIDFAAILDPELMSNSMKPIYYNLITITAEMAMIDIVSPVKFDPFAVSVARFYNQRATKTSKFVNETTERQLKTTLIEGLSGSETNHELVNRVQKVFNQATVHRAFDIAQTESAATQTFADIEAWSQSGIVEGKRWYTAEDERVCVFCNAENGKEVGLTAKFHKKGEKLNIDGQILKLNYDHITGAPLHVRCRCVLIPIRKDI